MVLLGSSMSSSKKTVAKKPSGPTSGVGGTVQKTFTPPKVSPVPLSVAPRPAQTQTQTWTPQAPNISAQTNPTLDALQEHYDKYIRDVEGGTGRIMDIAAGRTADAAEGLKTQLREDAAGRGVHAGRELGQVSNEVQRNIARQNADIALGREGLLLNALGGAGSNASRNIEATQGEKRIGLDAYSAYNAAMGAATNANLAAQNTVFNQMMALLEARRSSPAYGY